MYTTKKLWLEHDKKMLRTWQSFLEAAGLSSDEQVTFSLGVFADERLIATASFHHNIIKCVAVHPAFQSENILGTLLNELIGEMHVRGMEHILVYTKPENAPIFSSLGFQLIIQTDVIAFMETGLPNFKQYVTNLPEKTTDDNAAIVMNANPFTKGHQYLVEEAAKKHAWVYVFVVSEDVSYFTTKERMMLVSAGVAHLKNVTVLPTKDYLVSAGTFPAYFLKDQADLIVAKTQATLDATLFKERLAPRLAITTRYVGEEPFSEVTEVYNQAMADVFKEGIQLIVLPRMTINKEIVSATRVRQALEQQDMKCLENLVPQTTYQYLKQTKK